MKSRKGRNPNVKGNGEKDMKQVRESEGFKKLKQKEEFQTKVEKLGLQNKNRELPPDEVDRKEVAKDTLYTLQTFIPYTEAWWEARAAEEELDDLKHIRKEIQAANELVAMTKMGRHEDALKELMDDTNQDFHYFNKLKNAEISKGRFVYDAKALDPFKGLYNDANRIRKAARMTFDVIDSQLLKQIMIPQSTVKKVVKKDPKDQSCPWRGKGKNNDDLKCSNDIYIDPVKTVKDKYGKDIPIIYPECVYHISRCTGPEHIGLGPLINIPNADGYCTQCYFTKYKKKVPTLTPELCPGVCPCIIVDSNDAPIIELCKWRPSTEDSVSGLRGYICRNAVIRNPETKDLLSTCGLHVTFCLRSHIDNRGFIEIPNIYGLCIRHHVAEFNAAPIPMPAPYPGMVRRTQNKGWTVKPKMWSAPTWLPQEDIYGKIFIPKPPPTTFFEKLSAALERHRYMTKIARRPKKAKIIQRQWRRYRVAQLHKELKRQLLLPIRHEKAIVIQSQVRRKIAIKEVQKRRLQMNSAALEIQRVYRGFLGRQWLRRDTAARKLQWFFKGIPNKFFRMAMKIAFALRRKMLARENAALRIARFFRLCGAFRQYVKRKRELLRRNRAVYKIGRCYRLYVLKVRPPPDPLTMRCKQYYKFVMAELLKLHGKRLRKLANREQGLFAIVPLIQATARGLLAKNTVKLARHVRARLRDWTIAEGASKPFLTSYLKQTYQTIRNATIGQELQSAGQGKVHVDYVAQYVAPTYRGFNRVPNGAFFDALSKFYQSYGVSLPDEEKMSIFRRFRFLEDATVSVYMLDELIALQLDEHKSSVLDKSAQDIGDMLPCPSCHRHGRMICGDCLFYKDCRMRGCRCLIHIQPTGRPEGNCQSCNHPCLFHRLSPLYMKSKVFATINSLSTKNRHLQSYPLDKSKVSKLLRLLRHEREVDMKTPLHLTGITIENALKNPSMNSESKSITSKKSSTKTNKISLVNSILRSRLSKSSARASSSTTNKNNLLYLSPNESNDTASIMSKSLGKALSSGLVSGQHMDSDHSSEYFLGSASIMTKSTATSKLVHMSSSVVKPTTDEELDATSESFWRKSRKNPNKNKLDMEKNFLCNFPMAYTGDDGNVCYTLDGSKLYLNVMIQLQTIINAPGYVSNPLNSDHPLLLRIITDTMQLVDRHWRKLIIDMRDGTLHHALTISSKERSDYLSAYPANSSASKDLEAAFLDLGFQARSGGPEIELLPFADLKPNVDASTAYHTDARGGGGSTSSEMQADVSNAICKPTRVAIGDSLSVQSSSLSSVSLNACLSALDASPMPDEPRGGHNTPLPPYPFNLSSRSASMRSLSSRSGSPSRSVEFPMTLQQHSWPDFKSQPQLSPGDLQRTYRASATTPIPKLAEILFENNRFICPFPGCGKSFGVHSEAFKHLSSHERRRRLASAVPLADAEYQTHWPVDIPWQKHEKFDRPVLKLHKKIRCKISGCGAMFYEDRMEDHLTQRHRNEVQLAIQNEKFEFLGKYVMVPPFDSPPDVKLLWCSIHFPKFRSYCTFCVAAAQAKMPRPPFRFYSTVRLHMREITGSGADLTINRRDASKGVYVKQSNGQKGLAIVLEVVFDSPGQGWIATQKVFTYANCKENKIKVQKYFDVDYEIRLMPSDSAFGEVIWYRVEEVSGFFYLMYTTKADFRYRLANRSLPTRDVYFIRTGEDDV